LCSTSHFLLYTALNLTRPGSGRLFQWHQGRHILPGHATPLPPIPWKPRSAPHISSSTTGCIAMHHCLHCLSQRVPLPISKSYAHHLDVRSLYLMVNKRHSGRGRSAGRVPSYRARGGQPFSSVPTYALTHGSTAVCALMAALLCAHSWQHCCALTHGSTAVRSLMAALLCAHCAPLTAPSSVPRSLAAARSRPGPCLGSSLPPRARPCSHTPAPRQTPCACPCACMHALLHALSVVCLERCACAHVACHERCTCAHVRARLVARLERCKP